MNIFFFLLLLSSQVYARTGELVVFASDRLGFPAGGMCYFSNSHMVIHRDGLLVRYTCIGGPELTNEMWFVNGEKSQLLVRSGPGKFLSDALSTGEKIFVQEYDEGQTFTLWEHDLKNLTKHEIPETWARHYIKDLVSLDNKLWFRFRDDQGFSGEGIFENETWSKLPYRGVSFFFAPTQSRALIVQKVRRGEPGAVEDARPDALEIKRAPNFTPEVVAVDQDGDPHSSFLLFDNYTVATGKYWMATARTKQGAVALLGENEKYQILPLYKYFKVIDSWPGAISASGKVILRGTLKDGRMGLWMWTEAEPQALLLSTDSIEANGKVFPMGDPMFYNSPVIDGETAFIGIGLGTVGQGILKFPLTP
jgi:hypothetical protein